MKIDLFSILAGSSSCDARCPFCVSDMTPAFGMTPKEPAVDWEAFDLACRYAKENGVRYAMITGKGEPTLFPDQITSYLDAMKEYDFGNIDLQTNGMRIYERRDAYGRHLKDWNERGMKTIAISIAHYDPEKNRQIYSPYRRSYTDLKDLAEFLHDRERPFTVRFGCTMLRDYIDDVEDVKRLMEFAKDAGADQLTIRPVNKPAKSERADVESFVDAHSVSRESLHEIEAYLEREGRVISRKSYGGAIYDVRGQNVCFTNSLTFDPRVEEIRQVIFFPDGTLRYDWEREDATIDLSGWGKENRRREA